MTIPTFDVEFTKDGTAFQAAQIDAVLNALDTTDDLLVLAHGWNNDMADAKELYAELLGNVDKLLGLRERENVPASLEGFIAPLRGRRFAAVRVFWPSKSFTDAELIPGGGAATAQAEEESAAVTIKLLDELKIAPGRLGDRTIDPTRAAAMEVAKRELPALATVDAQRKFVKALRSILDESAKEKDDASAGFFSAAPETLFANAARPVSAPGPAGGGGNVGFAGGGAAGFLGDLLDGVQAAARRIANFATYYQMKARAGRVGAGGVADMLKRVRATKGDVRIHLVGHSFGGRLVTAAAHAFPADTPKVTMSLLQAAFSHNGLSGGFGDGGAEKGFFRALIDEKRISGPIIITHTKNDRAVGIAYPIASRIAGQNAAALGDQNDPYGGMGRNGAQKTVEADNTSTMGLPGTAYSFEPGKVHNILSDVIINHGDVRRIEVAYAILCAAGSC